MNRREAQALAPRYGSKHLFVTSTIMATFSPIEVSANVLVIGGISRLNVSLQRFQKRFLMLFAAALGLLLSTEAYAHNDTTLKVEGSEIIGLPDKYKPCTIDWDKGSIRIKDKMLKMPEPLSNFLKSNRHIDKDGVIVLTPGISWKLMFSASWYHDKTGDDALPDYMIISLEPKNKDYRFKVSINLETVSIIDTTVILLTFNRERGDVWVNQKRPISEDLVSEELHLVVEKIKY